MAANMFKVFEDACEENTLAGGPAGKDFPGRFSPVLRGEG